MLVMISQPMFGLSKKEINENREKAINHLKSLGYCVVNTYFNDVYDTRMFQNYDDKSIYFLSKSIEIMSFCDAVYFCKGWEVARGCIIQHKIAKDYNRILLYEQ